MKSQFTFGYKLSEEAATKIAKKLDFVAELAHGQFIYEYDHNCTTFIAPRKLGMRKYMRCEAFCMGYKLSDMGI
jgi:hypothetical protein